MDLWAGTYIAFIGNPGGVIPRVFPDDYRSFSGLSRKVGLLTYIETLRSEMYVGHDDAWVLCGKAWEVTRRGVG